MKVRVQLSQSLSDHWTRNQARRLSSPVWLSTGSRACALSSHAEVIMACRKIPITPALRCFCRQRSHRTTSIQRRSGMFRPVVSQARRCHAILLQESHNCRVERLWHSMSADMSRNCSPSFGEECDTNKVIPQLERLLPIGPGDSDRTRSACHVAGIGVGTSTKTVRRMNMAAKPNRIFMLVRLLSVQRVWGQ